VRARPLTALDFVRGILQFVVQNPTHFFRPRFRYVDAAARAATLRATHAQLVLLMKRADNVDDVLKVQLRINI
jgi:hypothetical protein